MGFHKGGVLCDKCGKVVQYESYTNFSRLISSGINIFKEGIPLPDGWQSMKGNYLNCPICMRLIKIRKLYETENSKNSKQ